MVTSRDLQRRWLDRDGLGLARAVKAWLCGGSPRPGGLDEVGGRVDLRGISLTSLPTQVGSQDDPAAGACWEALDLRGADVDELRLFGSVIRDCLFDRAGCVGWRVWGSTIEDCSFDGARMTSRGLGGGGPWNGRSTVWRRVSFTRTVLRESSFVGCVLQECTVEAPGRRLVIQDCDVDRVIFRGPLPSLIVTGQGARAEVSPLAFEADFSQAVFDDTSLIGYVLDRTLLPKQEDLRVVRRYRSVLGAAIDRLQAGEPDQTRQAAVDLLAGVLQAHASEESDWAFDLGGLGSTAVPGLRERLDDALFPR